MATLEEIIVKIKADTSEFSKGLSGLGAQVSKGLSGVGGAVSGIGKTIGGATQALGQFYLAVKGIEVTMQALQGPFKAWGEQEQAIVKLNTALASAGNYSQQTAAGIIQNAGALQTLTGTADEALLSATAKLQNFAQTLSGEDLKTGQKALISLSTAMGTDLETSARILGSAVSGATDKLGRLPITLKEGGTASERLRDAMQKLTPFFRQKIEETKTLEGQFKLLSVNSGEVGESLGAIVSQGLNLTGVTAQINQALVSFNELLINNADGIAQVIGQVQAWANFLGSVLGAAFKVAFEYVRSFVQNSVKFFSGWYKSNKEFIDGLGKVFQSFLGTVGNVFRFVVKIVYLAGQAFEKFAVLLSKVFGAVGLKTLSGFTKAFGEGVGGITEVIDRAVSDAKKKIPELKDGIGDAMEQLKVDLAKTKDIKVNFIPTIGTGGKKINTGEAPVDDKTKKKAEDTAKKAAEEAKKLSFAKLEGKEAEGLNKIKQEGLKLEEQLNALKAKAGLGDAETQIAQNKLNTEKELLALKQQAQDSEYNLAKAKIEADLKSKTLTKEQAAAKLADLDKEKNANDLIIKQRETDLQYSSTLLDLESKKQGILGQIAQAQAQAAIDINSQVVPLQNTLQAEKDKLAALIAQKAPQSEIEAQRTKIQTIETDIATKQKSITNDLATQITNLQGQLEPLAQVVTSTGLIYENTKKTNELTSSNKDKQDAVEGSCQKTTTALDTMKDAAQQVGDTFSSAIKKAIETGEFDFKEFASTILDIFLKLAEQIASTALGGFFGGGGGVGSLFTKAVGGPVAGQTPYLVGERGPELFVPNRAGKIYTNRDTAGMMGGGGGGMVATSNTFNINALDSRSVVEILSRPDTRKFLAGTAVGAVQRQSNKTLQRSTME